MKPRIHQLEIPAGRRIVCVSDIHGNLSLFTRLLDKVGYNSEDVLVLVGDLYTKGTQGQETLRYLIALSARPNVHILRGNCDWREPYVTDDENAWLDALPHIIETREYIFVHGGLPPGDFHGEHLTAHACMKNDAFMEQGLSFDKYVITGHWPVINYTHAIPSNNPIVDHSHRIIAIDGGNAVKTSGELNAFIISPGGGFSFDHVDNHPVITAERSQSERGGRLNITWKDRYVSLLEDRGGDFGLYRHLATGAEIELANRYIWTEDDGRLCGCRDGFDYFPAIAAGERLSLVDSFDDRLLIKRGGVLGWLAR